MADLTLYLGNKNYSSWSLRAWLALRRSGLSFREEVIPLYGPESRAAILRVSPSGRVPVLHDGTLQIWDSLAIGEYVAERAPDRLLWPGDREQRALARAVTAEMHAGFASLRSEMPMNLRRSYPRSDPSPAAWSDATRIMAIWRDLRRRFGQGAAGEQEGPFLFGGFTLADAAFAPVVARFHTYGVELDEVCQAYADAIWALPDLVAWRTDAGNEPMIIEEFERP